MRLHLLMTSALTLSLSLPALGGPVVVVKTQPSRPAPARPSKSGSVVVVSPSYGNGNGGGNPAPVRTNPRYRPPVVVNTSPVYTGQRTWISPRSVNRSWAYRPNIVIVRSYPMAITPIYITPITTPVYIPNQPYSLTQLQGELWPSHSQIDYMRYFTHYTISMDRMYHPNGMTQTYLNLHPQIVCQDHYGCADVMTPHVSRMIVTSQTTDYCGITTTHASAVDMYAPVQSIRLTDYSRYNCDYNGTYNELQADLTHYDGYQELSLSGNRTF